MASKSQPLSNEQMRRTWAMVDVLTSLKRRTNQAPPTADFIRRKFEAFARRPRRRISLLGLCLTGPHDGASVRQRGHPFLTF